MVKTNIADRIRQARENKGYDQTVLAEKIEVAARTVQRWEKGSQVPDSNYLLRLAKFTGIRPEWLLTGEGEMYKPPIPAGKIIPFDQEKLIRKMNMVELPVFSTVPAGRSVPYFHSDYAERYITVDNIKDPRAFALVVKGKSMSPMIEDGDIVVVSPQQEVRNGDISVIRINEEDVLKKIKMDDEFVHLIPINNSFEPVSVRKRDVTFIWKVVRVIKNL